MIGAIWGLGWRSIISHVLLGAIVVLIGNEIIFDDVRYIMWKPSIINASVGILILSSLILRKGIFGLLFGSRLDISISQWRWQHILVGLSLLLSAVMALIVAKNMSVNAWILFRLYVGMFISFAFPFLISAYIVKVK